MIDNISYITYTHSNCKDIWGSYLSRLDQYSSKIKNYVLSNEITSDFKDHVFIQYDDSKNYCQEFVRCLREIPGEYFIYMQEDFILYNDVDLEKIKEYLEILKNDKSISYVRLIKCGNVTQRKYYENLYYVSNSGSENMSINSFSMQPTIWKKQDFINLYLKTNASRFGEGFEYAKAMNSLNINGVYHYDNEPQRGGHFDSKVFPYIATAIVKGKWNLSEYPNEIIELFKEHNINGNLRGYR